MATSVPGRTATGVARGEERRAAIVAAATDLFAEQGVRGTSLSEIAGRAGIKRPALLHHFPSKEAVIHAVLDGHERAFRPVQRSIARFTGLEAIEHLVEIAEFDLTHRARVQLWNQLLAETAAERSTLRDRILGHYGTFRFAVAAMLEQAYEAGELRDGVDRPRVANTIIAFFNGIETSWLLDPELPMVATVEAFLAETIAGVAPTPATPAD